MTAARLFIVPTPLGNLEDITLKAIRILGEVQLILAEDTRVTHKLLQHYQIRTPVKAFHAFNEHHAVDYFVNQIAAGTNIALVSDAGTPGISDPGFLLVRACREKGIVTECLPGPTAFVPALVASGLPCDKFFFEGFLPHKKGRQTRLKRIAELEHTVILYESPHRLVKCLEQLAEYCGPERMACVARELTKIHEEVRTDTLAGLLAYYGSQAKVRGEIVLVMAGK
ncbi:MAG: 16S rRNA (cytidine(1402)-2'-O)-methyltransferase [Saprospiraceae bacterium]|nr:16S rRNA (cytidine(1402)-2'-O)-methyltransferase [Saprospiraceae bacterium]MDP4820597.1 16S rRNA (cytidine(1402)-2'-O)-methyltransferase [Saprospiraceae bacterium]MDP5000219.1 16S rRNA (cytidine(1402)-2'-O)-methyltransferase [Saprospiraceae bacterium]